MYREESATSDLASYLRMAMSKKGMSISELARKTGMERSTIHYHLRGKAPSQESIQAYARALEVPIGELATAAGFPSHTPSVLRESVQQISLEMNNLDDEALDAVWQMVQALKKRHQG